MRNRGWQEYARPEIVKYLLIFESPPMNGNFMYNPAAESRILTTVLRAFSKQKKDNLKKHQVLCRLEDEGIYAIDACLCPAGNKKRIEKWRFIRTCAEEYLVKEIEEIDPENKIVVCMKDLYDHIIDLLEDSNCADRIYHSKVPFPEQGHQKEFTRAIRRAVKNGKM